MNSKPLFTHGSPYAAGVARRRYECRLTLWLNAHEGKIIPPVLPYGFKLPAGWHLEDATIPAISGGGYYPGLPALPRAILRRGTREEYEAAQRKREAIAAAFAAKYAPAPPAPRIIGGSNFPPPWEVLAVIAALAGLVALCWYSSNWAGQ